MIVLAPSQVNHCLHSLLLIHFFLPIMQERITNIPVQDEGLESGTVAPDSVVVNENPPETVELAPLQPMPLRRSQRERRPALPDDYVVYSGEVDYDIGEVIDPVTFY